MHYASGGSGGGSSSSPSAYNNNRRNNNTADKEDALEFLLNIFPQHGSTALPHARSVSISDPRIGTSFSGVVLHLRGTPRTLYVDAKRAESVALRESIVALLDLASEHLECEALVIALDKTSAGFGELLHSLMYVGGVVVSKPVFKVAPTYVLVGMEI
jgi:hypothetical protein